MLIHAPASGGTWSILHFDRFSRTRKVGRGRRTVCCVYLTLFLNGELSSVAPFIMRPRRHQIYAKFMPAVVALGIFWSGAPIVIKFMQRERVAATQNKKLVDGSETFSEYSH
jgi:hypothetical protein